MEIILTVLLGAFTIFLFETGINLLKDESFIGPLPLLLGTLCLAGGFALATVTTIRVIGYRTEVHDTRPNP